MLPLRTLSYTLTILLLSSCSVTKSLYKDKEVSRYNPNVSLASKNYSKPAGEDTSDKEAKASGKQQQPVSDSLPETETHKKLPYRYPLPRMTFGETESANVRIPMSLNNPFPPSGELEIPLAELESDFCYPYPGKQISGFGYRGRSMHTGVDIKAVPNDTIRAAFSGVVRMSKPYSGYGNIIVIRHYNGMETAYAHNSRNLVTVNDVVKAGDPIALAGRTGRATTEHLHFEFRVANQALNPSLLLDTENQRLHTNTLYLYNRGGNVKAATRPLSTSDALSEETVADDESALVANGGSTGDVFDTQRSAATSGSSSNNGSKAVYHTIKSGDTLSKLARTYSTSVSKICQLNHIKPTTILRLKQRLRVK